MEIVVEDMIKLLMGNTTRYYVFFNIIELMEIEIEIIEENAKLLFFSPDFQSIDELKVFL